MDVLKWLITAKLAEKLQAEYRRAWQVELLVTDNFGKIVFGRPPCRNAAVCEQERAFAIGETLRWGEPTVVPCAGSRLLWAAPIMLNNETVGGLVAAATERRVFAGARGKPPLDIRGACTALRELAERHNLAGVAALERKRDEYAREQRRAYAIHSLKGRGHERIRELYLREEPALFSAIRSEDLGEAREILNRILVAIHQHAGDRLELVKSFFLELVVSMSRTAVESGANPEDLLGGNFERMAELGGIADEEELSAWLRDALEHLLAAIPRGRSREPGSRVFDALAYMERHCGGEVARADAARAAHLSPSHFSWLIRRESGATFTELLCRMRVDKAAQLLAATTLPLGRVAQECGFRDQSYFTKVFKKYRKVAPLQFRRGKRG